MCGSHHHDKGHGCGCHEGHGHHEGDCGCGGHHGHQPGYHHHGHGYFSGHHGGCCCQGWGGRFGFQRRFQSQADRIIDLEAYLRELEAEAQGVREHLAGLRSSAQQPQP
jgi:hypothetical protein